jgi:hypothetical protein
MTIRRAPGGSIWREAVTVHESTVCCPGFEAWRATYPSTRTLLSDRLIRQYFRIR